MRVFNFVLCFMLMSQLSFGQKEIIKKNEVIIIKSDEKGEETETIVKELSEAEDFKFLDDILKSLMNKGDSVEIDVNVEIMDKDGKKMKKRIIKSINADGEIDVEEILEEIDIDTMEKGGVKKKIMILDTDEEGMDTEMILKKIEGMEKDEDIEIMIEDLKKEGSDSIRVEVRVDDTGKGAQRKVIVKTIKDGKEEIQEITEDEEGEGNVFLWRGDADFDMASPKVSMGVLLVDNITVNEVVEGSAAAKAGIQKGDKIMKVDQQIIYSISGLLEHLTSYEDGDKAIVTIERDGQTMTKEIVFKEK